MAKESKSKRTIAVTTSANQSLSTSIQRILKVFARILSYTNVTKPIKVKKKWIAVGGSATGTCAQGCDWSKGSLRYSNSLCKYIPPQTSRPAPSPWNMPPYYCDDPQCMDNGICTKEQCAYYGQNQMFSKLAFEILLHLRNPKTNYSFLHTKDTYISASKCSDNLRCIKCKFMIKYKIDKLKIRTFILQFSPK